MTAAAVLLAIAACSSGNDDPGALTPQERNQLNDAAAMLDANSVALKGVPATTASGDPQS